MPVSTGPFYPHSGDNEDNWGTDVRRMSTTQPGTQSWTVTFTGGGPYLVTVDPFTNKSSGSADDLRTNLGWAFNAAGSPDEIGSVAAAYRKIPAGVWSFEIPCTVSGQGGGLGGSAATGTIEISVYRVAADDTRTLLFTATSTTANASGGLLSGAATTVVTASSASQPEIILLPGETIHYALRISSGLAGGGLFGNDANAVWTIYVGTQGANTHEINLPGEIMYFYNRDVADTTSLNEALSRVANYPRTLGDTTSLTEAVTRLSSYNRFMSEDITGLSDTLQRVANHPRLLQGDITGLSDTLVRLATYNRLLPDTTSVVDAIERTATYYRSMSDSIDSPADVLVRVLDYNRFLVDSIATVADSIERYYVANRLLIDSVAVPSEQIIRTATYGRELVDTNSVTEAIERAVTYRRYMTEELSEGGGNITYIIKRTNYLFGD